MRVERIVQLAKDRGVDLSLEENQASLIKEIARLIAREVIKEALAEVLPEHREQILGLR